MFTLLHDVCHSYAQQSVCAMYLCVCFCNVHEIRIATHHIETLESFATVAMVKRLKVFNAEVFQSKLCVYAYYYKLVDCTAFVVVPACCLLRVTQIIFRRNAIALT